MCEYTQVVFIGCGHTRYTVRAWCTNYERTHRRCKPDVVALEWRMEEKCGDCRLPAIDPSWMAHIKNNHHIQT